MVGISELHVRRFTSLQVCNSVLLNCCYRWADLLDRDIDWTDKEYEMAPSWKTEAKVPRKLKKQKLSLVPKLTKYFKC